MANRVGQQLGNYHLVQLLGEGGFADVYLGEHMHLGTQAAIKVLRTRLAQPDIEQFHKEARTSASLDHPHIIRVLDYGVDDALPFLVMSYAPNGTLRKRHPRGVRLPLNMVVSYITDIASALAYTHARKLIHRDIKPENLLVGRNGEILLSDFGIALVAQSTHTQGSYDIAGTVAYMAPEQLQSHPRPASDQYSLAIVVYEWLSGDRPFSGSFMELVAKHNFVPPPPLSEQVPNIPPEVERVVMTALAKDPQQRFATITAFATALAQASQPLAPEKSRPSYSPPEENTAAALSYLQTQHISLQPPGTITPAPLHPPAIRSEQGPSQIVLSSASGNIGQLPESSTAPNQPLLTPILAQSARSLVQPRQSVLSRRSLVVGLVGGLVGAGAVGGLTWYLAGRHTPPHSPDPTPLPVTSPDLTSEGTMFGYDAGRTHYNRRETLLSPSNVAQLVAIPGWHAAATASIVSSPVVANGNVYIGSWDRNLYAFNALTGVYQWSKSAEDAIDSSPAVAGNIVYIASQDAKVYAFNGKTGKAVWNSPAITGSQIDFSSPLVIGGRLYIGSHDHKLYALDAQTGAFLWTALINDAIWSSPAFANGIIYISSRDGRLHAFNAATGKSLWSASTGYGSDSSPAVANGIVYVGSYDHKLYAFDAKTGKSAWPPFVTGSGINASPAVANGIVYIGSSDHYLYALDATSGQSIWPVPVSTGGSLESSPTVANGVVYIGSDDQNVYAFDASSGRQLWSARTGAPIFSSPTVNNGILYVASKDNKLYAFHVPGS